MSTSLEDEEVVVVRDNTSVLLMFLLIMAVTMILLSVALVRLGNITRKLDTIAFNTTTASPLRGGGFAHDTYFYVQ